MAASWDHSFPLLIISLALIRGFTLLPTTSYAAGTIPTRPERSPDSSSDSFVVDPSDYGENETTVTPFSPDEGTTHEGPLQLCDYNLCLENQRPCAELKAATGCLCPGFTPHDQIPQVPTLRSVSWSGSEVVVWWCAPTSNITGFIVTVGGQEKQRFGLERRSGGVGNVDHITEVCVIAVNEVGESESACSMYQPRDSSLPLIAGLIGGALGFLLLLLLMVILLWRHKRQRKQETSISMHDTAATQ
ncbi:leucine-rich repeat neuronal protein 4 [Sphaeramia orbicularis]|uniref:Leucine-rich repeat neuronal protein 4-like n=1 Tax=Sphaeramia orbicularis TaxID=375764 RepID=A0A672Z742_9TELE|nr:leucine-rich repeat neuronal protein 4-like [Sphaeramia orbicularis]